MEFATLVAQLTAFALLPIFWLPLAVVLVGLLYLVINERGRFSTFVTIVFAVLVAAKFPAVVAFMSSPLNVLVTVAAYAIIGVLWSRYKWSNFLTKQVERFVGFREAFLEQNDLPKDYLKTNPDDTKTLGEFANYLARRSALFDATGSVTNLRELHTAAAPRAKSNKGSIVMWIGYWPISIIWFLLADFLKELGESIYRAVGGHFQKMSDAKFDAI